MAADDTDDLSCAVAEWHRDVDEPLRFAVGQGWQTRGEQLRLVNVQHGRC